MSPCLKDDRGQDGKAYGQDRGGAGYTHAREECNYRATSLATGHVATEDRHRDRLIPSGPIMELDTEVQHRNGLLPICAEAP
jgi:hypothetical protein